MACFFEKPNGLASSSLGLPEQGDGYPGNPDLAKSQPQGGCVFRLHPRHPPAGHWTDGHNPDGVFTLIANQ
jgi:hypothetical protein